MTSKFERDTFEQAATVHKFERDSFFFFSGRQSQLRGQVEEVDAGKGQKKNTYLNIFDATSNETRIDGVVGFAQMKFGHDSVPDGLLVTCIAPIATNLRDATFAANVQVTKNEREQFEIQTFDVGRWTFVPNSHGIRSISKRITAHIDRGVRGGGGSGEMIRDRAADSVRSGQRRKIARTISTGAERMMSRVQRKWRQIESCVRSTGEQLTEIQRRRRFRRFSSFHLFFQIGKAATSGANA